MSHTVHLAVFGFGCLYLAFVVVRRAIWGSQGRLRAERYGARGAMLRDAVARVIPATLFVVAALEAHLTWVWIALTALVVLTGLALLGVALGGRAALAEQDRVVEQDGASEQRAAVLASQKRMGRLGAVVIAGVLALWIHAWWDVVL
jgi:hypothetical protein